MKIQRFLLNTFVAVLLLLLVPLLLVQGLRAWAKRDPDALAALAVMDQVPGPHEGRNGYTDLLYAELDIPEDEREAAFAAEVAAYQRWFDSQGQRMLADAWEGQFESPAKARYPIRRPPETPETVCGLSDPTCLQQVAANPEAYRASLQDRADVLALADASLAADRFESPFPPGFDAPLPAYNLWRLSLTAAALQALDGDIAGATERSCAMLASARRFAAQRRGLIDTMVPMALTEGAAGLLLELRRAHPEQPLPANCGAALAPVQAEDYLMCDALRSEFRMQSTMARQMQAALSEDGSASALFSRWYLVDGELTTMWSAEMFADACSGDYRQAVLAGTVPPMNRRLVNHAQPRCYAAYASCVLVGIATPVYDGYQVRLLDHAARLRLLLALIAQAEQGLDDAGVERLAASPGYTLKRADGRWQLGMRYARGDQAEVFEVPAL
jgi:hypothetical protein